MRKQTRLFLKPQRLSGTQTKVGGGSGERSRGRTMTHPQCHTLAVNLQLEEKPAVKLVSTQVFEP